MANRIFRLEWKTVEWLYIERWCELKSTQSGSEEEGERVTKKHNETSETQSRCFRTQIQVKLISDTF